VQRSIHDGTRRVSFQLWDWDESGDTYRMESVLLTSPDTDPMGPGQWAVRSRATVLRAWRREHIAAAAGAAGLVDPVWHETDWQPIFTAVRPR